MKREPITDCGCPYDDRLQQGHRDGCPTLRALTWPDGEPKIAPVQGYVQGIPWSVHLDAYNEYERKWRGQAALIDLDRRGCRGGFGVRELDDFLPGWRERVNENTILLDHKTRLVLSLRALATRALQYVGEFAEVEGLECDEEIRTLSKDALALLEDIGR